MGLFLLSPILIKAQFIYTNVNGSIKITGYTGSETDVSIPDTLAGLPVTAIGSSAFENNTKLTDIFMPATVTNLEPLALHGCSALNFIVVDGNNPAYNSINGVLFDKTDTVLVQYPGGRSGDYVIPAGVHVVKDSAFANCQNLTGIEIPGSTTALGSNTFFNCLSLGQVKIDNGLTEIGPKDFFDCISLTNIFIPGSISNIGYFALAYCYQLPSISFPGSVTNVGVEAFYSDSSLAAVTFSGGVGHFGSQALSGCDSLISVIINGPIPTADKSVLAYSTTNILYTNNIVYYIPGNVGTNYNFAGYQALPWNPLIQTQPGGFGIEGNQFGFNITGTSNLIVLVQGNTSLAGSGWQPLATLNLTNGSAYFSEPVNATPSSSFFRLSTP